MTKENDALVKALAEMLAVSSLSRSGLAPQRAAESYQKASALVLLEEPRRQLLEVAIPADRWYRAWVKSGRLGMILASGARLNRDACDPKRGTIELPRLYTNGNGFAFEGEVPGIDIYSPGPNFNLSLGATLDLKGGGPGMRGGRAFGTIAQNHTLADLAKVDASKLRFGVAGLDVAILRVGIFFASLFNDDGLEALLARIVRREATHLLRLTERANLGRAARRGDPAARAELEAYLLAKGELRPIPPGASPELAQQLRYANAAVVENEIRFRLFAEGEAADD